MNALLKILPAIREVRAPLAAGYMWFLTIWLAFGSYFPSRNTDSSYAQLWKAFDALHQLGIVVAVSITAYLVGSLSQLAFAYFRGFLFRLLPFNSRLIRFTAPVSMIGGGTRIYPPEKPEPISVPVAEVPDKLRSEMLVGSWRGDQVMEASYRDLIDRELVDALRALSDAAHYVDTANGNSMTVRLVKIDNANFFELPVDGSNKRYEVPSISLLDTFPLIESRLLEISERTGLGIEQLRAEAAFREAVVVPLVFLVLVMALQVSPIWLVALIGPLALLWQARLIRINSSRQLLDALRARAGTEDMRHITPVFSRCRQLISQLADALHQASWGEEVKAAARGLDSEGA
jgi:hypothetical protein